MILYCLGINYSHSGLKTASFENASHDRIAVIDQAVAWRLWTIMKADGALEESRPPRSNGLVGLKIAKSRACGWADQSNQQMLGNRFSFGIWFILASLFVCIILFFQNTQLDENSSDFAAIEV